MLKTDPTLLLTRPRVQAERFAAEARARFGAALAVVISPLTEIVFLDADLPAEVFGHIAFTSENGVAAYARLSSDRSATAWCVGGRTASAATEAGFFARQAGGDWQDLARRIVADGDVRRILLARPVHVAGALDAALGAAGIETRAVTLYDQRRLPPSAEALALTAGKGPVVLPLFSPRSARLAAEAFAGARAPLRIAALSEAVADAARGIRVESCATAARPEAEALLDALAGLIAPIKSG